MEHLQKIKSIAATLARLDGGTMEEKAKALGISRTTLWRWSKKPHVREEMDKFAAVEIRLLALNLLKQLIARMSTGDLRAIKVFFELDGLYDHGVEERVRRLIDAGITPKIYERLYSHITKSYPAP
jgi:hypothetical protein